MDRRACAVRWGAVVGLVVVVGSLASLAGPLDPPGGPVAPTGKTLTEVEPRIAINSANTPGDADSLFKITQRGSYYLTGNITGVVGKHGIEIAASGVTVDLNGFDLEGVPGMGAFDGVACTVTFLTGITVINGSVRSWGDEGVDLQTADARNCRVAGVLASDNAGNGIAVGADTVVTGCAGQNNGGSGIDANNGCSIQNCSTIDNTGVGIFAQQGCAVSGCSAVVNGSYGIFANSGSTLTGCSAVFNVGDGLVGGQGTAINTCAARFNQGDGISVNVGCTVRGNTCVGNGAGVGDGAGVHATGGDNRIEDNTCTDAERGIDVDLPGNIIVRNACSGNTLNWAIAANNVYGPIVDRTAPASPAVNGNSAASSLGTIDANANYTY